VPVKPVRETEPATVCNDVVSRQSEILDIATEIIRENGDYELPMRTVADRARISLTTLYGMFKSKDDLIGQILQRDLEEYSRKEVYAHPQDKIAGFFDRLRLGLGFYEGKSDFYRSLFKRTSGFPNAPDPSRDDRHAHFLAEAVSEGVLREWVDAQLVAALVTAISAKYTKIWAVGGLNIEQTFAYIAHGYAILLAGLAEDEFKEAINSRIVMYQNLIRELSVIAE